MTASALHPGTLIATDIGRNSKIVGALIELVSPFTKNTAQGAATSVYATVHEPAAELAGAVLAGLSRRRVQRRGQRSDGGAAIVGAQ